MSAHVDKIEITVKGDVPALAVQSFELNVAVNSIPSITLEVLPVSRSNQGTEATAPTFDAITELYNQLAPMVKTLDKKATIHIKLESYESENIDDSQEVTLTDWVLTDVGLSSVTTYAAPSLTVIFSHPIAQLDHRGTIYEVPLKQNKLCETLEQIGGSNVLDIMDEVYNKYAKMEYYEIATPEHGGPDGRYKDLIMQHRKDLGSAINLPKTYLVSKNPPHSKGDDPLGSGDCGLFLRGKASFSDPCLVAAIACLVAPKPWGNSTWQRIISEVCPALILQVVPTYDQKTLNLEPYTPWQGCSIELDTNRIESIDLASIDTDPIFGSALEKFKGWHHYVVNGNVRTVIPDSSMPEYIHHAFYFPDKLTDPTKAYGRIEFYADNAILTALRTYCLGAYQENLVNKELRGNYSNLSDEDEKTLCQLIAEAIFEGNYRKHCKAAFTTIPTFKDTYDNMIYPGRVITAPIATSADGQSSTKDVLYGYLSRMTIKGSADGGGSSYYELMTARDTEDDLLVTEDTRNPCYQK